MTEPTTGPATGTERVLTIDQALGEFPALLEDVLGEAPAGDRVPPPETPQEADTRRFLLAQYLIGRACPAPSACADYSCRRDATCKHLDRVRARYRAGRSSHPRRPPGAEALRYAIWVYVSARRERG
jgi:hypothetical protein